jgi:long-chain fatty acid transport protein
MPKNLLLAASSILAAATAAHGIGFRVAFMDTEAMGRGNAFAATADTPAALFYNPAGLTQLDGFELQGGSYLLDYSTRHTAPGGQQTATDGGLEAVPHFYFAHRPTQGNLAWGVGAHLPFGLATDWPREAPFSAIAMSSRMTYLRVNGAVAYQVTPTFSIAAGPSLNYSELEMSRAIPPEALGGFTGAEVRETMDDAAVGFHLSARWAPTERHAFGAAYHSRTRMNYTGTRSIHPGALQVPSENVSLSLPFPDIVTTGYSFRPTPLWNLEVNVDWTNWERLNTVVIDAPSGATPVPFNWKSTFMYSFGVTRHLPRGNYLSAGYLFSEDAVPDTFYNPMIPDSKLHFYSLGTGRRGQRFSWHAAYHYGYGPGRDVAGSVYPGADGRYETDVHGFSLTLESSF